MARMMDCKHPSLLLNVQYRMHPDISVFPNAKFYQSKFLCFYYHVNQRKLTNVVTGKVHDGEPVRQKEHGGKWHGHPLFPTYAFFDIKGTEEKDIYSRSLFNPHEVNAIGHLISSLVSTHPLCKSWLSLTQEI
jgi:senataxin